MASLRLGLPHPFVLLLGGVAVAAALTWVLPPGEYERREDLETGRRIVQAGTYHDVPREPVGPLAALIAVPRGIVDGADVIVVILFVGGVFGLLDHTGALGRLIGALVGQSRRPVLVMAGVCVLFATLGALENMHEEIIALIPVMLVLSRGLGYGAVTALAMSVGSAAVGAAFGPTNPFASGVALRYAELSPMAAGGLRFSMLIAAVAIWIGWTILQTPRDDVRPEVEALPHHGLQSRDWILLALVIAPFGPYVYGVLALDWGFNELSALFLVAGFGVGLVAGMGWSRTAMGFLKSMETVLVAALFVGVARAISVVLTDGHVIDTIVHGLAQPLDNMPRLLAAGMMVPMQALLHVPVMSNSGQAVLTMPIMAPVADLLSIPREVAVMAYLTGGAMTDMLTPTNGALLAMLLAAGVPLGRWLRFAIPGALLVSLVGFVGMALAM